MFGSNTVPFVTAMWVTLCLIGVSLFAGVLLGDRYRPFSNDTMETRVKALEDRVEALERASRNSTPADASSK